MSDSTEQQDTPTEQQTEPPTEQLSLKEFLANKLNPMKTGCGCLVLSTVIVTASLWALIFGAPYQVKCTGSGRSGNSVQRFGDRASAEAYYARQTAAFQTCTKKYPRAGSRLTLKLSQNSLR